MSTTNANGRVQRKSLAGQLDRLDSILDGFADNLNQVIVQAVKEAVSVAVEAALTEVLTNADLQKRLNPSPAKTGNSILKKLWGGLVAGLKGCWNWLANVARRGRDKVGEVMEAIGEYRQMLVRRVRRGLSAFARRVWFGLRMAWSLAHHFRRPLLMALLIGTVIGVGCYMAGPAVSSLVSGLAGFVGSLIVNTLRRLRSMLVNDEGEDWCVSHVR